MVAGITGDWYWLVLVVVVLFGGSQLPKLARNAGEAMKEFRKAHNDAMGGATGSTNTAPAATLPAGPVPPPSLTGAAPANPLPAGVPTTTDAAGIAAPSADERVTLTRSELDALLAHREAQARAANTPPS